MPQFYDRVKETTSTTGTGDLTLAGAATGFRTFSSVLGTNDTCYYAISSSGSEWEVGIGTLTGSTTLARTQILASSNSNAVVSLSSGTKDVYLTFPAQEAQTDQSFVYISTKGFALN